MIKIIEQVAKKAEAIGLEAEILSPHAIKAFPKNKEQKQAFYQEVRKIREEHPKYSIEISYDYSQMESLSNAQRKEEIRKIGELVKKFGGFIEVEQKHIVHCYLKTESQAEVIRKNKYKWYDMSFWLDDEERQRSPLFINVAVLYSDNKALSVKDRQKLFHQLEKIVQPYHADLEFASRSEIIIYTNTDKRKEILQGMMKKYNQLRVHTNEEQIELLNIQVMLKNDIH
jgi:hypothetical protein